MGLLNNFKFLSGTTRFLGYGIIPFQTMWRQHILYIPHISMHGVGQNQVHSLHVFHPHTGNNIQ